MHLLAIQTNLGDYVGQIVLAIIVIVGQIYSSWDKQRIRIALDKAEATAKSEAERVKVELMASQEIAKAEAKASALELVAAQELAVKSLSELTESRTREMAEKLVLAQAEVVQKLATVHEDLAVNTAISKNAFAVANGVNEKIIALHEADAEHKVAGRVAVVLADHAITAQEVRIAKLEDKVQAIKSDVIPVEVVNAEPVPVTETEAKP